MSIINGYKEPRFKITDQNGGLIATIDLPLTGSKGLVESYEVQKVTHRMADYSTLQEIRGYIVHFTLHYDSFVSGETLTKLKQVLDYMQKGYAVTLIPRIDVLTRQFIVYLSSDSFDLGLLGGYNKAKGHRLPVITFSTKYLQTELPWAVEAGIPPEKIDES